VYFPFFTVSVCPSAWSLPGETSNKFTRRPFLQLATESTTPLKDSFLLLYLMLIFDFSVEPPPGVGEVEAVGLVLELGFTVELAEGALVQFTIGTHDGGNGLFDAAGLPLGLELDFGDVEPDGWAGAAGAPALPRWADAPTLRRRTTPAIITVIVRIIHFQDLAVCLLI